MNERMLHVHCGDSSADTLRKSDVGGTVITWCDPLIEGATPADISPEEWLHVRAVNLLGFFASEETAAQALTSMNAQLEAYRTVDEVVLWFDACLFDQIILIRQLDWFARQTLDDCTLSLICVGEFPGHARFHGLGELHPAELASLLDTRHAVTPGEFLLAQAGWGAYRAPDPTRVERLLAADTGALPHLHPALLRHLERFPSTRNGLNRLQHAALAAIAAGKHALWDIMRAASAEIQPAYFGDSYLFAELAQLAAAPRPLLREEGLTQYRYLQQCKWPLEKAQYRLTDDGVSVLRGEDDWIALSGGIDRWLGGVHLHGAQPQWRWDEEQRALVES